MGCDFYIYIYLEIEHGHGTAYFELPVRRGYFSQMDGGYYDDDFMDEEMENNTLYNRLYSALIDLELTPYPPKVIYENDAFVSAHFQDKYKPLLNTYFQDNLLLNQNMWSNQKYDSDEDDDDAKSEFKDKRYEDEGILPDSFASVLKITRKEDRHCPSRN